MNRVTVYGDSILKLVLMENGSYRRDDRAEKQAEKEFNVQIENRSYFGSTAGKALARMRRDREKGKPFGDFCVIEFGGNDASYHWEEIAADPDGEHHPLAEPETFRNTLLKLADCAAESGAQPILTNLPPIDAEAYFNWLTRKMPSPLPLLQFLGSPETLAERNRIYSALCEETAAERSLPLVDIRTPFERAGSVGKLMCADGVHPNTAGQNCLLEGFREHFKREVNAHG